MKDPELSRLWTFPQAARAVGVSQKAIRAAVERGDLEAVRLTPDGWPRTTSAALQRWITARRIGAAAG